jgi:CheY-like chemotaxis protein
VHHRHTVYLVHWKAAEAGERVATLQTAGYEVRFEAFGPMTLRALRENPPSAVVIDLTRLPMHGRDVALALRQYKPTRHVTLLFVDGEPAKVARIREQVPDAVYTNWSRIQSDLQQAILDPPPVTVAPRSLLAGYSGTPLPKKLGIKAGSVVALLNAPAEFDETLGELPEGVTLQTEPGGEPDVVLWFIRLRAELEQEIQQRVPLAAKGGLWIVWPKKTSPLATDLTQNVVRETGLAAGLVDFKVCAIDATWSGLRFTRRRAQG